MHSDQRASAIDILFSRAVMKCTKCGRAECDCWERCSCGWTTEAGKQCRNPDTIRCSTKIKYGKWNRSTKRYEPKE
jgi:hypothetical protein